ncbi:MAG: hypothetical protein ABEJ80_06620 [Halarchaeum sp.]
MAVHHGRSEEDGGATLPAVVPFELSHLTRMSWELGSRTVDDDATSLGRWAQRDGSWRLAAFAVTSETAVIRARTPVGRERFYGAIRSELEAALETLESTPAWRAVE